MISPFLVRPVAYGRGLYDIDRVYEHTKCRIKVLFSENAFVQCFPGSPGLRQSREDS